VACVIVEPVAANMGVVLPEPGFLAAVRRLTAKYGIVLVFDEVISGFRLAYGGAQSLYGISPDLTCLGKIIGGGLPLAAFGGSARIMERLAPLGDVYQAGTLSGNPCAVAAGIAALTGLKRKDYSVLDKKAAGLCEGLANAFRRQGIPVTTNRCRGIFTLFFSGDRVSDFASAKRSDTRAYARYFHHMLDSGINLPPSQFEANFVSFCHSGADIDAMLAAARACAAAMKGS
jgi:glutamate-1-semialdehyde 2,1-aminomutase